MAKSLKTQEELNPLWRDLCEKLLAALKRRGFDVDAMSDAEFAELLKRLAQARPKVTGHDRRASSRLHKAR
jgi:CHASE2 domain-containing sensor protein